MNRTKLLTRVKDITQEELSFFGAAHTLNAHLRLITCSKEEGLELIVIQKRGIIVRFVGVGVCEWEAG